MNGTAKETALSPEIYSYDIGEIHAPSNQTAKGK